MEVDKMVVVPGIVLGRAKWNLKPHTPFFPSSQTRVPRRRPFGPVRALSASRELSGVKKSPPVGLLVGRTGPIG